MKVVKKYSNQAEAQIAKGFLESAGIKAIVSPEDPMAQLPGATLRVADPDYEKALEVLNAIEPNSVQTNED